MDMVLYWSSLSLLLYLTLLYSFSPLSPWVPLIPGWWPISLASSTLLHDLFLLCSVLSTSPGFIHLTHCCWPPSLPLFSTISMPKKSKAHTLPFSPGLNINIHWIYFGTSNWFHKSRIRHLPHLFLHALLFIPTLQGVFPYTETSRPETQDHPASYLPLSPTPNELAAPASSISQTAGSCPRLVLGAMVCTSLQPAPHHLHGNCCGFIEFVIVTGLPKCPNSNSSSTAPL